MAVTMQSQAVSDKFVFYGNGLGSEVGLHGTVGKMAGAGLAHCVPGTPETAYLLPARPGQDEL